MSTVQSQIEKQFNVDVKGHAGDLLISLNSARKERRLCDFVIKVGSKEIHAHKIILSECSVYFRGMFTHEMKEMASGVVEMKGVDPECMVICIEYIYTGKASIFGSKIQHLLQAADMLHLPGLCKAIGLFLQTNLDPDSFFPTRIIANTFNLQGVKEHCDKYAMEKFTSIAVKEDFKELENEYVSFLVGSKENQASEAAKCKALILWASSDQENRFKTFEESFQMLQLEKIPASYRLYLSQEESLVGDSTKCLKSLVRSYQAGIGTIIKKKFTLEDQPVDETDSKPTTNSEDIDEESWLSMIGVKSDDETEIETRIDSEEETVPKSTTISKEIVDKSESATKIAMESDDGTEAETRGATAGETPDIELQKLEFQYIPPSTDKEVGREGGNFSVDECSLSVSPNSVVDNQNLSLSMLMNFQDLDLPAGRIPVSPYLDIKFLGKLRIPAKARVPTWFMPSEDSEHGIKIYKRYCNEENKFAWRELQNEVTVHDQIIEFEVDHFCGFIAMIKDLMYWLRGEIRLSHGLLNRGENFLSAISYQSPESLFQQMMAHLEKKGHKEIYRNRFVMKSTQEVPIRMECFDPLLHDFEPHQHLLTPSDIRANESVQFPFLLQQFDEPKDAVKIKYIVNNFIAPFKVRLLDTKGDVSTVVNAPVGQLATGNANITNQGSGNNYVAGLQENTDRSVTAGKAIYGQSTSSSVGENITVHRTGT